MFYSQACQDKFIVNVLKGKRDGFFLEIGGGDPIITNNTYTLEKTMVGRVLWLSIKLSLKLHIKRADQTVFICLVTQQRSIKKAYL